jgi:DNA end-binding protein Ku
MVKAIFKGLLSFGLVNVPIALYNVAEPKLISFRLLHKKCKKPIKLKKYCDYCNIELKKEDIVHGIKVGNKYIEFTKEQIQALKPKGKADIEIVMFTDPIEIDDVYFDKAYYIFPIQEDKAYWLFEEVLRANNKVAIVKFIFHEKEHLGFIKPYKKGLLLRLLHYAYEIRKIESLIEEKPKIKFKKEEIELANKLVESLYSQSFRIEDFRDEFSKRIEEEISRGLKIKAKEEKEKKKKETLIELLQKSIKK